ncbi:MAG TPA: hypothetical protein ENG00_01090, partial [Candidatus Aenigmarchaeota archaeon]|nr:hypothetical protein [Candidatus Aenigmarchaeota archaeon]
MTALYLAVKRGKWYIQGLLLGTAMLFHWETGLVFSAVLLLFRGDKQTLMSVLLGIALASVWYVPFLLVHGLPNLNSLHGEYISRAYGLEPLNLLLLTRETGGNYDNIGILVFSFALLGLLLTNNGFCKRWFVFSLLLSLLTNRLLLYLVFPATILAVLGLTETIKKLGHRGKALTLVFVVYVILTGIVSVVSFAGFYPLKTEYETMLWIRKNTPENSTIFSDWSHGHWITGIAHRKSFIDGYAEYPPEDIDRRIREYNQFFSDCSIPD